MRIVVIDGQGGGIGRALVEALRQALPNAVLVAVGTNSMATSAMLKAGASMGATGENAVLYNVCQADVILGPVGIILANALLGEITPAMAAACAGATAPLVLVPVSKCRLHLAGIHEWPLSRYIEDAVGKVLALSRS